jgi:hypothetical protein
MISVNAPNTISCNESHCIALHCIALHCIALHHTKRASLVEEARDILDTGFAESFELDCAFARGLSAETITSGSHCYNAGTDEMLQSSR